MVMDRIAIQPPVDIPAVRAAIHHFLERARRPAILEPGEPLLLIQADSLSLEDRPGFLTLNVWDETRNLVRRISGVTRSERGCLALAVQRFGGRPGELQLIDLAHPRHGDHERKGSRLVFRERFRRMLERELSGWRMARISSDPDLEHTLSPAFPRALLTRGTQAIAAIGAPPEANDFPAMLSFGLIWLDYARRLHPKLTITTLQFWAPSPVAPLLSFYLPFFDPAQARFTMYLYSDEDFAMPLDPNDYGNVLTSLEPCRHTAPLPFTIPFSEAVPVASGEVSWRVAGLEFARYKNGRLGNGSAALSLEEAQAIAASLHAMRSPDADSQALIWQQNPEAWLESIVRSNLETVEASLAVSPVYGQVPAIAAQNRTVIDLLAVDYAGRLAVLELKASPDLHLPLQALDYWIRVKWHLDRGEFGKLGYFPGIELRRDPPRLLLVAPALQFHPSMETILRFFAPEIDVVRIGLSADWRERPRVMFRLVGAERPV